MYRNAWVQSVQVVRAAHHQYAIIVLQAVYFIQKVATHIVRHNAVQILEYKVTRSFLSRLAKDLVDGVFWASELCTVSLNKLWISRVWANARCSASGRIA